MEYDLSQMILGTQRFSVRVTPISVFRHWDICHIYDTTARQTETQVAEACSVADRYFDECDYGRGG